MPILLTFLPQRWSAWIAAALTALNITTTSTGAPVSEFLQWLGDPAELVYTYPEQQLDEFMDRSTVRIYENYTQIDGIWYDDVWLSHDAADKFRVNAFDLQTAYNIASNSNGTFASGVGSAAGLPVFQESGTTYWMTQAVSIPYQDGDYRFNDRYIIRVSNTSANPTPTSTARMGWIKEGYTSPTFTISNFYSNFPFQYRLYGSGSSSSWHPKLQYRSNGVWTDYDYLGYYNNITDPFSFDWISGVIPAEPLDPDDGLHIYVPHDENDESPLDQYIIDYPDYTDPEGKEIDVNIDPDVGLELDDLMDIIIPLIPIIKAEWGPMQDAPVPPVDPTLIANTPWVTLQNKLDEIISSISSIPQAISSIGDTISSFPQTILQDIEEGPIKVFDKALDLLKSIFAPILALVKNAIGIWHYVVEWLQSISAPWGFFWGVFSGLGSPFTLPIYAAVAGIIVIAVYKRFGR